MARIFSWLITFALVLGVGEALVRMTYRMASSARDAHIHDQISYAQFTKAMTQSKRQERQSK